MTESALLSAIGGLLGLVFGFLGMRALFAINTARLPRLGDAGSLIGMDWRVIGFTVLLSILTALLFGLLPVFVASKTDLNAVIKHASSRAGAGFRRGRSRSMLVIAEISLAVVLLIGAALLIRTMLAFYRIDPGSQVDNVVAMRIAHRSAVSYL